MQYPDIEQVGVIYSTSSPSGTAGAEEIQSSADALGIEVKLAGAVALSDLQLAADALVDAGVGRSC